MGFLDWFKKRGKRKEIAADEASAEILWASLCENPNQAEKLTNLISLCEKNTGKAGAYAALEELMQIKGSVLPEKLLLAMQEEKDIYAEAFQSALNEDGLDIPNIKRKEKYSEESLRAQVEPFRGTILPEPLERKRTGKEETPLASLQKGEVEFWSAQSALHPQETENTFLFSLDGPVWSAVFPELSDFLPKKERSGRVGLYFHSYTDRYSDGTSKEADISAEDLSAGISLCLSEQVFFLTHYQPVVLCPIQFEKGIISEQLETDVQTLLAICAQQKLDYLVTGTIAKQKGVYSIRTFVFHKMQQSIRIFSKDVPFLDSTASLMALLAQLTGVFSEKEKGQYVPRIQEIQYSAMDERFFLLQMKSKREFFLQYLIYKSYCAPSILSDASNVPDFYLRLLTGMPQDQVVFLSLLSTMYMDFVSGKKNYLKCRAALYHSAEKNKMFSFIRALVPKINELLKDPLK